MYLNNFKTIRYNISYKLKIKYIFNEIKYFFGINNKDIW